MGAIEATQRNRSVRPGQGPTRRCPTSSRGPAINPSPAPRLRAGRTPRIAAAATLAALLLLPALAAQQTLPLRLDCGDLNGDPAPEAGWTLLGETPSQWPAGCSFSPAPLDTVHVAGKAINGSVLVPADVWACDPDELGQRHRMTSLKLADPTTLTITGLPPSQPLRVHLELGALAPWADIFVDTYVLGPSTPSSGIVVEEQKTAVPVTWRTLARDVRCTTGCASTSYASNLGGIVSVWVLAHADASGKLVLRFSSTASGGADPIYLAGLEIHEHEALPVVYHKQGLEGPLVATSPNLVAFAAAFNAGDYDAAEVAATVGTNAFQRGVARCWLAGWLDGSRDGRFDLLPLARADLMSASSTHPSIPWLLSQMDDLQRALDHLDARGYSFAQDCPSEGGKGFLNPDCAGQTAVLGLQGYALTNVNAHAALRRFAGLCTPAAGATIRTDVDAWNIAPVGYGGWEPGPFLFAAAKSYGTTISLINPTLDVVTTEPESAAFLNAFKNTFQVALTGGGFETVNFPRDMELPLFRTYANLGSHPWFWSDAELAAALSDSQIDASWWGPLVAKQPDDQLTQGWIAKQRDVLTAYTSMVEYWLHERLRQGELGGGRGDDIEALLQFYPLYALRQDPSTADELAAIDTLVRTVLVESGDVTGGYFSGGLADVEHTGEYTSNTFQALRADFGYTARAVETALGVGAHLKSASPPSAAWAGMTTMGRLHFKTYEFTASGPGGISGTAFDIPLVGRATFPMVATAGRGALGATHPLLADLSQWAGAWRDDALDTSGGKPKGFFGPVSYPANAFGGAGKWWSLGTSPADTAIWGTGEASYILELLHETYTQSTATDRWRYLLPAVRVLRAVKDWEDAGKPGGTAGSANWAAAQFFNGPRFFPVVATTLGDLEDDPTLTSADDPDLSGTAPYVDGGLITRMHAWVESTSLPALNLALRYALAPVSACSVGSTAKSPGPVEFTYDKAELYWRAVYPLLTKHVLHTDRLFLNRNGILGHLTAGFNGCGLTEGLRFRPAVRWSSDSSLAGLSISCNRLAYDGTAYGAFLYQPGPLPLALDLVLDEGLQAGRYRVELGSAEFKCDEFPAGNSTVVVQKPGAGASVPLVVDPGLQLVRVTREAPPDVPAQRWDLALDPPRLEYTKATASLALRTRIVNAGALTSAPGTLRLYVTVLNALGKPVSPQATSMLAYTGSVPALAGSSGWTLAATDPSLVLPAAQVVNLLLMGLGLEFRAELSTTAQQWDPNNDALTRRFYLADLTAVVHPD